MWIDVDTDCKRDQLGDRVTHVHCDGRINAGSGINRRRNPRRADYGRVHAVPRVHACKLCR
jgi:hypothetical protein